jgi:hypothetical protein
MPKRVRKEMRVPELGIVIHAGCVALCKDLVGAMKS